MVLKSVDEKVVQLGHLLAKWWVVKMEKPKAGQKAELMVAWLVIQMVVKMVET